ncbi:hypothetical protein QPX29_11615, partial [Corynebacterium accolens]|uniref:hypothetical protein n=1 Tax=Corynebacterium accolens TaxID=38284 RepID=UPI002542E518
ASFASWSNFLGMFQIFPSTQTEQNLGHFNTAELRFAYDLAGHTGSTLAGAPRGRTLGAALVQIKVRLRH